MTDNLLQACWDGDLARVRELISQDPGKVNLPTENSKITPLFYAVRHDTPNALEVTRLLLDAGADANYVSDVDERGLTPLLAALNEDGCTDLAVVRLLVAGGADVNCPTKKGGLYTPLQAACHSGANEIVEFLLDSGADVNAPNRAGFTALHYACRTPRADEALVAMFLSHGAAVDQAGSLDTKVENQIRPLHCTTLPIGGRSTP